MNSVFTDADKRRINKDFIIAKVKDIGATFRNIRLKLNISQVELAKSAEISQDKVSRVENGKPFEIVTLLRLCEALGVNMKITFAGKIKASSTVSLMERKDYEDKIAKLEAEIEKLKIDVKKAEFAEDTFEDF